MDFVYICVIAGLAVVGGILLLSIFRIFKDIRDEQAYSPLGSST